ncbi:CsbD family protein [Streptomyces sp. NBC_00190]|uniref:CsbD family protein n=1 Tax=unclassified Streptomyces TaxID=2593676 RepID=UPI002E2CDF66|nr:CsbD family protein [Streptomyces sp. NBC_00190]WSZ44813.1 CsbD family protein [Streptomyces sp. NBC_00868]
MERARGPSGHTGSVRRKAEAKGEQAKGKLKETAGRLTGNERMTAEGRAEQAMGDALEATEKIRVVFMH